MESICRQQNESDSKIEACFGKGSKHCGRRQMLVTSIFSFPHIVFKRLLSHGCKRSTKCGKELHEKLGVTLLYVKIIFFDYRSSLRWFISHLPIIVPSAGLVLPYHLKKPFPNHSEMKRLYLNL